MRPQARQFVTVTVQCLFIAAVLFGFFWVGSGRGVSTDDIVGAYGHDTEGERAILIVKRDGTWEYTRQVPSIFRRAGTWSLPFWPLPLRFSGLDLSPPFKNEKARVHMKDIGFARDYSSGQVVVLCTRDAHRVCFERTKATRSNR
jgi:hypothetical protein